ncbi:acyltransferase [Halalkalibacter wakoensis JCM 9140]|uniref:Acyltransferase n=1 Tax=Halalkalibacter wakoensis JCM 9140 TaxID=1236970 RepID=W4Q3K9_9BACI|nr:GNAT family N-acetyltransferase [Halalkalibacter wakoensis]GAE26313.1 acyltransferase [Halalkalibacter wakoensis JCM 9140]
MKWTVKTFEQLSIQELYEIMSLRVEVFVVEQECPYQELDGKDQEAYHLLGRKNGELVAYSRLFKRGKAAKDASIGRVIVKESVRKEGIGKALLTESIAYLEKQLQENVIVIHAQLYLQEFYQSFGFKPISDVYLLDGIHHLDMRRRGSDE